MIRLLLLAAILATTTPVLAEPSPYDAMTEEEFIELGRQGLRQLEEREARERLQQERREREPQRCPRPDFRDWSRGPAKGRV